MPRLTAARRGSGVVSKLYRGSSLIFGGGAPAPFTPADLGPALWLDASTLGLANNAAVSSWTDLSGNARHATQATGTKQPTFKTGILNGLPVLGFSGDCLVTPSITLGLFTVAVVFRSSGTAGLVYEHGPNAATTDGAYLYGTTNNTVQVRRGGTSASGNHPSANWATDSTWRVAVHRFNGTRYGHLLRLNGAEVNLTTGGADSSTSLTTAQVLNIGSRANATALPLTGDIAEIVVIPSAIGVEDQFRLENYLAGKWGLTIGKAYRSKGVLTLPQGNSGTANATHPDVVDFGASPYGGYRYWMAFTPFPPEAAENPTIIASNHPETGWVEPAGITNPIDPAPAGGYNADTDLVHDAGTLYCFYGSFDGVGKRIVMKQSSDGVTWGAEQELFAAPNYLTYNPVSPAVVKIGSTWHMWYVNETPAPRTMEHRTAPAASGPWSAPTVCTVIGTVTDRFLWHLDVFRDSGGVLRAVIDYSTGGNSRGDHIHLASSSDGDTWTVNTTATFAPRVGLYDNAHMYRSGAALDGDVVRIWLAGANTGSEWRVGYARLPLSAWPTP